MKKKHKLLLLVILSVVFLIGVGILTLGITTKVRTAKKDAYFFTATGKVVDWNISKDSGADGTDITYFSIIGYYADGVYYEHHSNMGGSSPEELGKERIVRYHPDNPEDSYLDDGLREDQFLIFTGLFFIGVPLLIAAMTFAHEGLRWIVATVVFGGIGAGLIWMGCLDKGRFQPFGDIRQLIGCIFLAMTGPLIYSVIYSFRHRRNPVSATKDKVQATVIEIQEGEEDEKEILLRDNGESGNYYLFRTISSGYFEIGKTYAIQCENIEGTAPVMLRNEAEVYDLQPTGISWMDFVYVPSEGAYEQQAEVLKKVGKFYEENKEEVDNVVQKAEPVVKTAYSAYTLLTKLVFVAVYLLFVYAGVWMFRSGLEDRQEYMEKEAFYESTEGTVSEWSEGKDDEGDIFYQALVTYFVGEKTYETKSRMASDEKEKEGTVYTVKYNPQNPEEAYIQRKLPEYYFPMAFGASIIFYMLAAILMLFQRTAPICGYIGWSAGLLDGAFLFYFSYGNFSGSMKFLGMVAGCIFMVVGAVMLIRKIIKAKKNGKN